MKRFIIISVLAALATDLLACAIPATHNYYLFSVVEHTDWMQSIDRRCMDNWEAYSGKQNLYWFDAVEMKGVAQAKGDALMMSYIDQLQRYLGVVGQMRETWEYPTKQQLQARRQTLLGVQKYALSKTKTRLRSQHALLYMRCNMLLDLHQTNVTFWEQTASKYINSVYRDMMRNIYAGALLKTGRSDEATQIFMEQGDVESLYTYYYNKRSFEAIQKEYQKNPNAAALPFLLQDFANNAQEAIDAQNEYENWPGKLFVRDIKKQEALQMCTFASQVLREGKTENPAMWKSLEAWLQYLFENKQRALNSIREAVSLAGTSRVKANARVIRLFIEADMGKAESGGTLDNFLAEELAWLDSQAREERGGDNSYENHYTQVYDRLVHQVLIGKYEKAQRGVVATAFLSVYDEQPKVFFAAVRNKASYDGEVRWNADYSTDFFDHINRMPVDQLEQYLAYTCQQPSSSLDKWLSAHIRHDEEFFHEVLGTKYLRLGRWAEAEQHLSKVSLDFINTMNIVPFMARRDFRTEPWLKRQRIKDELQMPGTIKTSKNQKLDFVREMATLEQGFGVMEPAAKARRAYDLAVRYTQASYAGDAWYLSRYGKSVADSARADEMDMLGKACELLEMAKSLNDFRWQEKTLFALAFLPVDSWYSEEWNSEKADYVKILHTQARQYKALQALSRFKNQNLSRVSSYVSHCDVLKQFEKAQTKR
jgi:hypothetical protein